MDRYLGLMSGTSLDGVDVAVVEFDGREERPGVARLAAFRTFPYQSDFRDRLRHACSEGTVAELCELNFALGRRFGNAAARMMEETGLESSDLVAIGSHGQTVWHEPPGRGPGSTLQVGEAAVIAEATGVPVVADFRVRDMAAGGHGAPMAPYFDRLLLTSPEAARGIQNLGGMGNLTALPRTGASREPVAFDTGPGTALLDAAVHRISRGREAFDEDGRRAARGHVSRRAMAEWLEDPFFRQAPPRSTGRERFSEARLARWLDRHRRLAPDDLVATLAELTARSVADSLRWIDFPLEELYLCGGGARNPLLRRRIGELVGPLPVGELGELGWDGDAREAAAFALLARQHVLEIPVRLEWATGARGARRLGKWVPA